MKPTFTPVHFGEENGYLFESNMRGGVCFVPEACLRVEISDEISVDEVAYLVSGWARLNASLNHCGHRLFPNARAALGDFAAPLAARFLSRMQILQKVSVAAA